MPEQCQWQGCERILPKKRGRPASFCPDHAAEKQRQYREAHAEEIAEKQRQYREARKARREALLAEFVSHLQAKQPKKPGVQSEYLISAAVKSNHCAHCGRIFIQRFDGDAYCRRPACQSAERKAFSIPRRIAITKIARSYAQQD
jgi:NMD protein affecting ribosome stability and mRNA decay